MDLTKIIIL